MDNHKIRAIAFSSDGTMFATGSNRGVVRMWDRSTGALQTEISIKQLRDSTNDTVHPLDTGKRANEKDEVDSHLQAVTCIAFSPSDGTMVLGTSNGTLWFWNSLHTTATSFATGFGEIEDIKYIVFSADGSKFLIASFWSTQLWCRRGNHVTYLKTFDTNDTVFFRDSTILTTSISGDLCLWDNNGERLLATFNEPLDSIASLAVSPTYSYILFGLYNGIAHLWDTNDLQPQASTSKALPDLRRDRSFSSASFSRDGLQLLLTYPRGLVCPYPIWRLDVQLEQLVSAPFYEYDDFHDFSWCTLSNDKTKMILKPNTMQKDFEIIDDTPTNIGGSLLYHLPANRALHSQAVFSLDNQYILACADNNTAKLYDARKGTVIETLKGHSRAVTCVAISPDSTQLLTGSMDGTARLWTQYGSSYKPTILSSHKMMVWSVALSPDGTKAFSGSEDTLLGVWDVASGKLLEFLDGRCSSLEFLACSPGGTYVLTSDRHGQVRVWCVAGTPPFRLVGAYATRREVLAAHWQGEQDVWLVDGTTLEEKTWYPRLYRFHLEGAR